MSVDKSIDLVSEKFLEHDDALDVEEKPNNSPDAGEGEAVDGLDGYHKNRINDGNASKEEIDKLDEKAVDITKDNASNIGKKKY